MSLIDALRKVKLTPPTQLLLLVGLTVVASGSLGVSFVREQWDQDALSAQIDLGEEVLIAVAGASGDLDDLQTRLRAAEQELAAAETALPSELDSKDILEMILAHAAASHVRLLRIDTQPPTADGDGANAYDVLGFDLEVEGDFGQLVAFLEALEDRATSTTRISMFAMQEVGGRQVMNLELLAYARSPAPELSSPEDESSAGEGTTAASEGGEALSQ